LARVIVVKEYLKNKKTVVPVGDEELGKKEESKDPNSELKKALDTAIVTEKPNVKWKDVAGLEKAKDILMEAIILPNKFPQLFGARKRPWTAILLYGPSGTGKSSLAKACASELQGTFFSVNLSDLISKWFGEPERLVRSLFEMGKASCPAVIFIDEIDSLGGSHNDYLRRVLIEFLAQMDGVNKDATGLLVLGATDKPWELDRSTERRFEKRIYIPLPKKSARKKMFELHLSDTPFSLTEEDLEILAEYTEGYSGSDISSLVKEALTEPIRKCRAAKNFIVTEEGYYIPTTPGDPKGEPFTLTTLPDPKKLIPSLISLVKLNIKP